MRGIILKIDLERGLVMPYKRVGKDIYVKKGKRWVLKQRCKSVENAKKALKILYKAMKEKGER